MKKAVIVVLALFSLALTAFLGWLSSRADGGEPRFQLARTQPRIGAFNNVHYEFLSPSPFEGGKMWITIVGGSSNFHCYLYDIDHRKVLGELFNASPIFMNGDQSKLLCAHAAKGRSSLRSRLVALIRRIIHPKTRLQRPSDPTETFWVLDLNRNSATRIGQTARIQSTFQSSPTFRYGYVKPMEYPDPGQLLLCDLEKECMIRLNFPGYPQGWWDERTIIAKDPTNNFALYDVVTGKRTQLWSSAELSAFFEKTTVSADPAKAKCFSIWNGKENVIYLTDPQKKWEAVESFLVKVGRPDHTLTLVSPNFKFEWSDHLDATGAWYLYTGRNAGQASSGVFVRDMRSNAERTLVPSDGGKYFSIPRFYRDGVIYTRSNMLWRIGLDGSNQTRLFPPPDSASVSPQIPK